MAKTRAEKYLEKYGAKDVDKEQAILAARNKMAGVENMIAQVGGQLAGAAGDEKKRLTAELDAHLECAEETCKKIVALGGELDPLWKKKYLSE